MFSKFFSIRLFIMFIFLTTIPFVNSDEIKIKRYVNDYANILSPEEEAVIEDILLSLNENGLAQVSVVTIDSLEGSDIESYSINLAQGHLGETDKNNGLLILVAVKDRKYRFEVGRGLEPVLTDSIVGRIGREYLVPNFREGNYGKGMYEAVLAVSSVLNNDVDSKYYVSSQKKKNPNLNLWFFVLITSLFVLSLIISINNKRTNRRNDDDYFFAGMMAATLFGNRGRGGFGGFGGFGGGGFGGGGSSGGW